MGVSGGIAVEMPAYPAGSRERHRLEAQAGIMRALAHPSRLMILERLSSGRSSVGELSEMVGCHMSTISRHLSIMKNADVIACDKEGPTIFYNLRIRCALQLIRCADTLLN